jgi:preprotein translocase subunit SecF
MMARLGTLSRLGNIGGALYRGEVSVEFVGRRKLWYSISGAIVVVALVALIVRGLTLSIDFQGGDVYKFTTAPSVSQTAVTNTFVAAGSGSTITVQRVGTSSWSVQTPVLSKNPAQATRLQFKIQNAIARKFGIQKSSISIQAIGPTWGAQIVHKAIEALIFFLIVIVLYLSIAFEWRMATAAFVALLHDIVITVGVYALLGFEVSPATVIGLLTILGYSLYDTVVVFDKVRENTAGLLATRRSTYSYAANLALNQTLVRSINTSLIALLPIVAILSTSVFLLGNGELKDLALVLFVGMLSGTYSSICIATPVLADLKERESGYVELARQLRQRATSAKRQAKAAAGGSDVRTTASSAAADGADAGDGASVTEVAEASSPMEDAVAAAAAVAAGRPVTAGSGSRAAPGPRQQPRRPGSAQRRPAGKKKRR